MDDSEDHGFQRNIQQLHKRVGTLETDVASLTTDMSHVRDDIKSMNRHLEQAVININEATKPNVQVWIAAIGVLVVICSMIGTAYYRDVSKAEKAQAKSIEIQAELLENLRDMNAHNRAQDERLRAIERETFNEYFKKER